MSTLKTLSNLIFDLIIVTEKCVVQTVVRDKRCYSNGL